MADFNLTWIPSKNAISQTPQHRKKGDVSWINSSPLNPSADIATVSGLLDNTIYEFRVESECTSGNFFSDMQESAKLLCPEVTITLSGTSLTFSFTPYGDDMDSYTVQLYKNGIYNQQQVFNAPFSPTITDTFSGLSADNIYKVRVKAKADTFEKICSISTDEKIECAEATDILGTVS